MKIKESKSIGFEVELTSLIGKKAMKEMKELELTLKF